METTNADHKMYLNRPKELSDLIDKTFADLAKERKQDGYGAKGELTYEFEALDWVSCKKKILLNTDSVYQIMQEKWGDIKSKKFIDLGCGDGRQLWQMNKQMGIPFENVFGVTGEEMRGCNGFDIREEKQLDNQYFVDNIETLYSHPKLAGMKFDYVNSFVTWIWLTDPIGDLQMAYDMLNENGFLLISDISLGQTQKEFQLENRVIFALKDYLVEKGHKIEAFVNCSTGTTCMWLMYKGEGCPKEIVMPFGYSSQSVVKTEGCTRANYDFENPKDGRFKEIFTEYQTGKRLPTKMILASSDEPEKIVEGNKFLAPGFDMGQVIRNLIQ